MENKKVVVTIKLEMSPEQFLSSNFDDAFGSLGEVGNLVLKSVETEGAE